MKPESPPSLASLTIKTQPGGAAVFLNGDRKGNSPLTINDLAKGSYTVKLELDEYESKEEHVTLGQENQLLDIKLEKKKIGSRPSLASLTINTQPSVATVFLNEERKGNSPLTINDLKKGSYTIRLEVEGYETKEEHITLGQENQTLDIKLEKKKARPRYWLAVVIVGVIAILAWAFWKKGPEPPTLASLTINTQPSGAMVFLNGDPKGNSNLTINDLKKGSYVVRLVLKGYETKEEMVSLEQDSHRIEVMLEPIKKPTLASLTINTQPSGASVFLDGSRKGNSPLTINDLKKGSYTVRLEMNGYETKEEKVLLDQNSHRIEVMLAAKPVPPTPLASLTINTQPSGATVILNGSRKGNSPQTINDLKKGRYTVRLELNGYETKEEKVLLDQNSHRIEVMLAAKSVPPTPLASLTINTQPSGASVFLNDSRKGNSPLTINNLKKGKFTVRVERDGQVKEEHIYLGAESKTLEIVLGPQPIREEIEKYLAEGKLLFQQGKYDRCIEIMNKVLQMSKNNSAAQWYIREATKRIENSNKLSNPSAAGGRRW